jgi:DNA repair protein RadD
MSEQFSSKLVELWPHQVTALDNVRSRYRSGASSVCLVSPTGSGKTVMFCSKRCLILAHRSELVEQTSKALVDLGVPHGVVAPNYPETPEPVQVASVQSLIRRLDRHDNYDLVVIDECHHAVAGTYQRIIEAIPSARLLGVTATPERSDGRGLGDAFETMVVGSGTAELIAGGYLSPFAAFAPTEPPDLSNISIRAGDYAGDEISGLMGRPVIITSAVDSYERLCPGRRAIVFGVDIRHSMALAEKFKERGHAARHLDAETPREERRRVIQAFASGEVKVLTNVNLFSEGFDAPGIEAVLLVRPTKSLAMHLQQVGRVLRIAPGKERALILDLAGNLFHHGMPDADRDWSLEAKPRNQRERDAPRLRRCKGCGTINKPHAMSCTTCGATLVTPLERREIEAELAQISRQRIEKIRRMEYGEAVSWAGRSEERLRQVALARGYRPKWVRHRLQEMGAQ